MAGAAESSLSTTRVRQPQPRGQQWDPALAARQKDYMAMARQQQQQQQQRLPRRIQASEALAALPAALQVRPRPR
jgi:hypothetical protein